MRRDYTSRVQASRFVRALPLMGGLAAAALIASQALSWWGIERAAKYAERAESEALLDSFAGWVRSRERLPTREGLHRFLEAHREQGLRYAAIEPPELAPVAAGEALLRDPPGHLGVVRGEDRIRVVGMQPPPRHGRPPGLRRQLERGQSPGGSRATPTRADRPGPPGRPPGQRPAPFRRLTVEVIPQQGAVLRDEANRTLAGAGLLALLFIGLTVALRRSILQREAELRRSEDQRRLAALGEMSAVMAHELRSPLTSLKGHAQLLLESLPHEGRAREKATRIVAEAERMQALTASLLRYIRSGELNREEVDLRKVIERAAEGVGSVEFRLPATPIPATVDEHRLVEAIRNLLANAAHAGRARASLDTVEDGARIEVSDDGPGVPPSDREAIFEPFFSKRAAGTGLGLPIARRIVESHGGTLRLEPSTEGARFVILLPHAALRLDSP